MDLPRTQPSSAQPASSGAPPTPTGTTAEERSTTFRPVTGGELQSGEKLLVEAYAAIWLILLAMVLLSWRRQRHLDERMGVLATAIDKARREAEKGGA